jgi:putative membrane protein (TIGR04086 family)
VVDYLATYLAIYSYFFLYWAKKAATDAQLSPEAIAEYMQSHEGLMIGMTIGALGTLVGGFAAGLKAGSREAKHGAFVGLGSLTLSFIEQQLAGGESRMMPEWMRAVSVLSIIPAGALGGMLAGALRGDRGPVPSIKQ